MDTAETARALGLTLTALGLLALTAWSIEAFLSDPEVPWAIKYGLAAAAVGVALILASVTLDRLKEAKK